MSDWVCHNYTVGAEYDEQRNTKTGAFRHCKSRLFGKRRRKAGRAPGAEKEEKRVKVLHHGRLC